MNKHKLKLLPLILSCAFLANLAMPSLAQTYDVADGGAFSGVPVPAALADGDTINLQGATASGDVSVTLPANLNINAAAGASTVSIDPGTAHLFDSSAPDNFVVNLTGDITFAGGNSAGSVFNLNADAASLTINTAGGTLYLTDNIDSNVLDGGYGGAISVGTQITSPPASGSLVINGALNASGNIASFGGAIFCDGDVTAGLAGANSTLSYNIANAGGGGIFSNGKVTLLGSWTMNNNRANDGGREGGAISAEGDVLISGALNAKNNYSYYEGSVIYSAGNITAGADGEDSSLINNFSEISLGALSGAAVTLYGNWTMTGNKILDSSSGGSGAAVAAVADVAITGNLTASDNSGFEGGAIYSGGSVAIGGAGTTAAINNNTAPDGYGGAIFAYSNVIISGSSAIDSNTATYGGGAIFAQTGSVTVGGAGETIEISNNSADDKTTYGYGGAIYGGKGVTVTGNSTISGNSANLGGAIYSGGNVAVGGAGATAVISSNTASGAYGYGGAIYSAGNVDITGNSSITGNTANLGGAIAASGASSVVTIGSADSASTLSDNKAITGNGGAVFCAKDVALNGSFTVDNNNSAAKGGAIYARGNVSLNATSGNFTFSGNTDSTGANAIYLNNNGGTATATLNAAGGDIIFYDPIASSTPNGPVTVNKTGAGMASFDGTNLGAGNTSMIYANTTVREGTFEVSNNAVYGALAADMGATAADSFTALAGTTVQGGGYGTLRADNIVLDGATLDIAGRQAFTTSGKYSTFVIDPSTLSMNGTNVIFNTYLGADSSPTDLLILDGGTDGLTATGQANITVNNTGGAGAQTTADGIKLVQVNNAATADNMFTLANRVAAGAYEYDLFKNGVGADASDGNWYLRSICEEPPQPPVPPQEPAIRPEVPAYLANMRAVSDLFMMNLHDRLGEPQYAQYIRMPGADAKCPNCVENDCDNCLCENCQNNGGCGNTGAQNGCKCCYKPAKYLLSGWARVQGRYSSYNEMDKKFDVDQTRYLLNGGADIAAWTSNGNDRWLLGIMGAYGHVGTNVKSKDVPVTPNSNISRKATADVDGTSAGAYLTWYASAPDQRGLYADIRALHGWFDNKVHGNAMPEENYKSQNTQVSAELGYAFRIMHKRNGRQLFIEPQGQFVYNFMNQDNHTETNGTAVNNADGSGWISRLGGRVYLNSETDKHHFQPFAEINWLHNSSKNKVAFDGDSISDDLNENTFELKLGASGMLAERWQLWGWAGAGTVNASGYSVGGNVGIRYSFGGPKACCRCAKEQEEQIIEQIEQQPQPEQFVEQPQPDPLAVQRQAEAQAALDAQAALAAQAALEAQAVLDSQRKADEEKAAEAKRIAEEAKITTEISDADLAKQKAEAEERRKRPMLKTYTLTAHFKTNSYFLSKEDKEQIDEIAGELSRYDYKKITIEGHTDNTGKKQLNKRLSRQRARSVYDEFARAGIPAEKMSYQGFADTMPVQSNATAAGRAANRRTEIFVE